jgi:peptide-methionine (S)-S-oxide reductase
MRRLFIAGLCAAALAAAGQAQAATQSAIFAGGCFWSMESGLEHLPGVVSVVSGYTGGAEQSPTYAQVSSERTGHLEAVKVTFDPAKISYRQLTDRFLRLIDPTDAGGMFCDRGPSYRSAIFVRGADQRADAEAALAALKAGPFKGRRVFTPVRAAQQFWPAESYHQDYARKNPGNYQRYKIGCGREAALKAAWAAR